MAIVWVSEGGSEDGRECSLITPSNRFMMFMVMMRKEAKYNENDRAQPPDDKTHRKGFVINCQPTEDYVELWFKWEIVVVGLSVAD